MNEIKHFVIENWYIIIVVIIGFGLLMAGLHNSHKKTERRKLKRLDDIMKRATQALTATQFDMLWKELYPFRDSTQTTDIKVSVATITATLNARRQALDTPREVTTEQAIDHIVKALKEDPGYKESWIANLSQAFLDADHHYRIGFKKVGKYFNHEDMKAVSKRGADLFLERLSTKVAPEDK